MMSIVYVFWMYVILFGIIGMLRGWAKELLVAFSVIVALTLNHVLRKYVPVVSTLPEDNTSLFWVLSLVLLALVFFGYQTVALIPHLQSKATRERLQDSLFGAIVGGLNGYLIFGTVLFYLAQTQYQALPNVVHAAAGGHAGSSAEPDDVHAAAPVRRARDLLRSHPVLHLRHRGLHMKPENALNREHVHFIGIGGSGLSAIARMLKESGYTVTGSDLSSQPLCGRPASCGRDRQHWTRGRECARRGLGRALVSHRG